MTTTIRPVSTMVLIGLSETNTIGYYARLEVRPEVGIVDDAGTARRIVPDVAVIKPRDAPTAPVTATVSARRATISASVEVIVASETLRHQVVEIRDASRGHKLITLIEIVSPSNKRPGVDRRAYLRKQREILESDASLVEIDLLRAGERLLPNAELEAYLGGLDPQPAYLVLVNRAWCRRDGEMAYQLFAVSLREVLPCIAIPLREGEDEVTLDLQWLFNQAYDRGPYRRGAVDYEGDPHHWTLMTGNGRINSSLSMGSSLRVAQRRALMVGGYDRPQNPAQLRRNL